MPAVQVAWRPTPRIASQLRAFLHPSAPRTCPRVGFERSRTRTSRVQAELPARFDFSVTQAGTVSTRWRRCKSICFLRTWPHFCGHGERKQDHAALGETLSAAAAEAATAQKGRSGRRRRRPAAAVAIDAEVTARRAAHHSSSPPAAAASGLSRAPPDAKRDPAGDGGPWRRPARDPSRVACTQLLE